MINPNSVEYSLKELKYMDECTKFIAIHSKCVKTLHSRSIQSSLAASSPPEAWPFVSLQWHRILESSVYSELLEFASECKCSTSCQMDCYVADNLLIRIIRAGFFPRLLRFPPLVSVNQLRQIRRLFGMPYNILMFQQLFGSWPLRETRKTNLIVNIKRILGPITQNCVNRNPSNLQS